MIAEPYICIKGKQLGTIEWFATVPEQLYDYSCVWQPYADFEREKLRELNLGTLHTLPPGEKSGYGLGYDLHCLRSRHMTGYGSNEYLKDSESSRLLKRAEFLKAVCEKEGVAWLPKRDEEEATPKAKNNGPCVMCGKDVYGYSWWTKNPMKYKDALPIHDGKCFQKWDGETMLPSPNDTNPVKVPIEPERDYYTKDEMENEILPNYVDRDEEQEWRKAILDHITSHVYVSPMASEQQNIKALRNRFL